MDQEAGKRRAEKSRTVLLAGGATSGAEKRLLESLKYAVIAAESADEALRLFTAEASVSLVLLDMDLGDGTDAVSAAEKILRKRKVPIVFLVSRLDGEILEKTSRFHSCGYIVRNSGKDAMEAALRTVFKQGKDKAPGLKPDRSSNAEYGRFVSILERMNVGTWELFIPTGEINLNERWADILGYRLEEIAPCSLDAWLGFAHPDDVAASTELLSGSLSRESDYFEFETRAKHKDGRWIWVLDTGKVELWSEDGKPLRIAGLRQDISRRKKVEDEFKENERSYRELFNATSDAIIILDAATGSILEVNNRFCDLFGYRSEDGTGGQPAQLYSSGEYPYTAENALRLFKVAVEQGPQIFEWHARRADGTLFWVEIDLRDMKIRGRQRIAAFIRDISERRQAEDALEEKAALLEAQANATIDGILVIDEHQKRLMLNRRIVELFQVPSQILEDENDAALLEHVAGLTADPGEFLKKVRYLYDHFLEKSMDEIEFKNGMLLDRYSAPVIGTEGKCYGRIWTFRDITARKRAEEALKRRLAEKEILLQEIHHRVKNNLTVISSLLSLQASSIDSPEAAITAFEKSRDRIVSMAFVHQKLYESGDCAAVEMGEYILDLANWLLQSHRPDGSIRVETMSSGVYLSVDTAIPIGLILNELISNALLHAFPGKASGIVTVHLNPIDESRRLLTVSDNGIGLPEGYDKRNTLGYTMINLLAEQIKGSISVETIGGTLVRLSFSQNRKEADS